MTILINADGCPGVSDEEQNQLPHSAADPFESAPLAEMVGI